MDWWLRLLGLGRRATLPSDQDGQNLWIKAKFREWQLAWHDFFDGDADLAAAGEFGRPDVLPEDIDQDYRLIFGLSRATPQTRQACFDLFPKGREMVRRFEEYLSQVPVQLPEAVAREELKSVVALILELGPNEEVDFSHVTVVNRDTDEGMAAVRKTDHVTALLERPEFGASPVDELPGIATRLFLTEPLYASAGNFYHLCDWVTAAQVGGTADFLQERLYHLWRGGWQVLLGEDGIVLAGRTV